MGVVLVCKYKHNQPSQLAKHQPQSTGKWLLQTNLVVFYLSFLIYTEFRFRQKGSNNFLNVSRKRLRAQPTIRNAVKNRVYVNEVCKDIKSSLTFALSQCERTIVDSDE